MKLKKIPENITKNLSLFTTSATREIIKKCNKVGGFTVVELAEKLKKYNFKTTTDYNMVLIILSILVWAQNYSNIDALKDEATEFLSKEGTTRGLLHYLNKGKGAKLTADSVPVVDFCNLLRLIFTTANENGISTQVKETQIKSVVNDFQKRVKRITPWVINGYDVSEAISAVTKRAYEKTTQQKDAQAHSGTPGADTVPVVDNERLFVYAPYKELSDHTIFAFTDGFRVYFVPLPVAGRPSPDTQKSFSADYVLDAYKSVLSAVSIANLHPGLEPWTPLGIKNAVVTNYGTSPIFLDSKKISGVTVSVDVDGTKKTFEYVFKSPRAFARYIKKYIKTLEVQAASGSPHATTVSGTCPPVKSKLVPIVIDFPSLFRSLIDAARPLLFVKDQVAVDVVKSVFNLSILSEGGSASQLDAQRLVQGLYSTFENDGWKSTFDSYKLTSDAKPDSPKQSMNNFLTSKDPKTVTERNHLVKVLQDAIRKLQARRRKLKLHYDFVTLSKNCLTAALKFSTCSGSGDILAGFWDEINPFFRKAGVQFESFSGWDAFFDELTRLDRAVSVPPGDALSLSNKFQLSGAFYLDTLSLNGMDQFLLSPDNAFERTQFAKLLTSYTNKFNRLFLAHTKAAVSQQPAQPSHEPRDKPGKDGAIPSESAESATNEPIPAVSPSGAVESAPGESIPEVSPSESAEPATNQPIPEVSPSGAVESAPVEPISEAPPSGTVESATGEPIPEVPHEEPLPARSVTISPSEIKDTLHELFDGLLRDLRLDPPNPLVLNGHLYFAEASHAPRNFFNITLSKFAKRLYDALGLPYRTKSGKNPMFDRLKDCCIQGTARNVFVKEQSVRVAGMVDSQRASVLQQLENIKRELSTPASPGQPRAVPAPYALAPDDFVVAAPPTEATRRVSDDRAPGSPELESLHPASSITSTSDDLRNALKRLYAVAIPQLSLRSKHSLMFDSFHVPYLDVSRINVNAWRYFTNYDRTKNFASALLKILYSETYPDDFFPKDFIESFLDSCVNVSEREKFINNQIDRIFKELSQKSPTESSHVIPQILNGLEKLMDEINEWIPPLP